MQHTDIRVNTKNLIKLKSMSQTVYPAPSQKAHDHKS